MIIIIIEKKKIIFIPGVDVLCHSDEVFNIVDVDDELSMCKGAHLELVARSSQETFLFVC